MIDIYVSISGRQIGEGLCRDEGELALALGAIAKHYIDFAELAQDLLYNDMSNQVRDFCENLAREIRELEGTRQ